MSMRTRSLAAAVLPIALVAALLGGCAVAGAPVDGGPTRMPLGDAAPLGPGFLGSEPSPSPEATVAPEAGSWDGVEPPSGYRVTLIVAGGGAEGEAGASTLETAVRQWADARPVELEVLEAAHDDEVERHLDDAVAARTDLVIGAGDGVVDVFALLTPQHLDQTFLMLGAELPEPTENVTSVIWPGAAFRGSGVGTSGEVDPSSFTPPRAEQAVLAGVASVLHGLTGIVVALPG
jgi:hypothetical protein